MKRKFTSILLILALVITMMPAAAMTAYGAINISAQNYDGIKWQIKEGVLHISKGTATDQYAAGEMGDAEMYGYKAWATYKDEITKVVVEDGVTRLGFEAFAEMPLLQSVEIAGSVETMGTYAFARNEALTSVTIKDGAQNIGEYAFYNCPALSEINIPDSVKAIGQYAFYSCSSLTDIAFPASVKTVGYQALQNTPFLNAQIEKGSTFLICGSTLLGTTRTDFYAVDGYPCLIPDGIVCIAEKAFYDVEITELEFPESLKYIGNYAFGGGNYNTGQETLKATSVDFKNVEYIGTRAFEYAHNLQNIDLSKVTYVGDGAFYWSNRLQTVKLADNMEYLGDAPFGEAKKITSITGPNFVKYAHYNSFYTGGAFGSSITDENGDGYKVYKGILLGGAPAEAGSAIVIPDGVTTVAYRALDSYNGATSMHVPETVTCIAFSYGMQNITDIYYAGDQNGWNNILLDDASEIGLANPFVNATVHFAKVSKIDIGECTVDLEYEKTTVNNKVKTPTVTVTGPAGNTLTEGMDYDVVYDQGRTAIGKYAVEITMTGSYSGSTTLYFYILPKATSTVKTSLGTGTSGYNDVTVKWDIVTGAKGYNLYYKKASASKWTKVDCGTKRTYTKKNLADGVKYNFKVVAYIKDGDKPIESLKSKTNSITTLKKVNKPTVKKYNAKKVKVSWKDLSGESGYQVYKMKKSGSSYKKVDSYKTTKASITVSAKKGTTYFYKVRAYKKNGSKTTYGPWSDMRSYKLPR